MQGRIPKFLLIITAGLLLGCGAFQPLGGGNFAQGGKGEEDSHEPPRTLDAPPSGITANSPHQGDALPYVSHSGSEFASNSPEWAASSPGTVVCETAPVVAKVQRSDHGMIQAGALCIEVKMLAEDGSYQSLPTTAWGFTAEYRDPVNGDYHDVTHCRGKGLLPRSRDNLPPPSTASGSTIEMAVRIFRVLHPVGEEVSCEENIPQGSQFSLEVTYPDEVKNLWQGRQDFTLAREGNTFDPFVLSR